MRRPQPRAGISGTTGSVLRNLLPPLAPPVAADQNPQLRVPAVGDVLVGVEVVQTVVAPLATVRLAAQDRVLRQVTELDAQLLVDRLGLRCAHVVDGLGHAAPSAPGFCGRPPSAGRGTLGRPTWSSYPVA